MNKITSHSITAVVAVALVFGATTLAKTYEVLNPGDPETRRKVQVEEVVTATSTKIIDNAKMIDVMNEAVSDCESIMARAESARTDYNESVTADAGNSSGNINQTFGCTYPNDIPEIEEIAKIKDNKAVVIDN